MKISMKQEELYYLANICYYDFGSEDDCTDCPRYDKCREKIAEYNKNKIIMEKEKKFKPYDRVLVRSIQGEWTATTFSHYRDSEHFPYSTSYGQVMHCIPYEGNEHLIGTNGVPTETPKPKERWRANIDEVYYVIYMNNEIIIDDTTEGGCVMDDKYYQSGNYFRTKEEAEEVAEKIKKLLPKGE